MLLVLTPLLFGPGVAITRILAVALVVLAVQRAWILLT
jgi:hypothetical protein